MNCSERHVFTYLLMATLTISLLGAGKAEAILAQSCGTWSVVSSPNPGSDTNYLYGVAAISANNVWAVGSYVNMGSNVYQTLVEHWDGASWNIIPSPNAGPGTNDLVGVAAISADNIWAVGDSINSGLSSPLIEHWDGIQWNIIPGPNVSPIISSSFTGVTAISANDVWAVGIGTNSNYINQTFIAHWDGTIWSVVSSPNVGPDNNGLTGIAATSAQNIWAVGGYSFNNTSYTLTEHWNGNQWSVIKSPNPSGSPYLNAVTNVPGSKQAWAVGFYSNQNYYQGFTERWNGSKWNVISSSNPTSNLFGVIATSKNSAWAVGYSSNYQLQSTLIEQWNGSKWSVITSPNPSMTDNELTSVTHVPGTKQIWAVGFYSGIPSTVTLIEYFC